jgi:thiamine biosynthesis lipoprotein
MCPVLSKLRTFACCLLVGLACGRPCLAQPQGAGDGPEEATEVGGYEMVFPAMGTILAFQAFGDDDQQVERVFGEARREVDRLVEILSDYSTESETVLLSLPEKVGQWQATSPELWEVLQVCDRWHKLSDGAFDASIGRLSVLWRKARKSKSIPTPTEIEAALKQCGWQHVHLDGEHRRVKLDIEGLKFDFGAMGKGYIIDKAYERLAAGGLPRALVRAGGDLRCGQAPPGRSGWRVEIAKIDESESEPPRLLLANAAVSSSGDLYQFIEIDGQRRSHVIDPRIGLGVPGPRMVTVIAATSTEADVADTALCVLPDAAALKLAERLGNIDVRIVSLASADPSATPAPAPNVHTTSGFQQRLDAAR